MKDLCEKKGTSHLFEISSAGTSDEEQGNTVHRGTLEELRKHGVKCERRYAAVLSPDDLSYYDLIVVMDEGNMRAVNRLAMEAGFEFYISVKDKIHLLGEYSGRGAVADPYYTGNFVDTWEDVSLGCEALYAYLTGENN